LNPSLESTEAVRIVSVGEHSLGTIGEDDLGQRRWMWATELGPTRDTGQTFNYLKALDVEGLSIADETGKTRAGTAVGYNPYDTAPSFAKRTKKR